MNITLHCTYCGEQLTIHAMDYRPPQNGMDPLIVTHVNTRHECREIGGTRWQEPTEVAS